MLHDEFMRGSVRRRGALWLLWEIALAGGIVDLDEVMGRIPAELDAVFHRPDKDHCAPAIVLLRRADLIRWDLFGCMAWLTPKGLWLFEIEA